MGGGAKRGEVRRTGPEVGDSGAGQNPGGYSQITMCSDVDTLNLVV